ncbi:hypothetical protein FHG12_07180 [Hymenobacter jejuensis]|uniref:Uncharacterized protein n=1 Tax=Hymenobacter jejuensis TaxID=2502781 RepID=A0A5B7ZZL1_9BACT|nr:hypothetical protein FHG12_07180 [Hymenobacter jejuensis]
MSRLVDYALVKWLYPSEVTAFLAEFEPNEVLLVLDEKLALNPFLLPKCLEIAAESLGIQAYAWVRFRLGHYEDPHEVLLFAHAIARCFPSVEANETILPALAKLDEKGLAEHITCLIGLPGNSALDWVETHCRSIRNVPGSFGLACAAVGITWERVLRWLQAGRPLSLIALDALVNCGTSAETLGASQWLRENPPSLQKPASFEAMGKELDRYLEQDRVPRTKNAVRFIKENWAQIVKQAGSSN